MYGLGAAARMSVCASAMVGATLFVNCTVVYPGSAQVAALPQPQFTLKDENDVDLLSANVYLSQTDLSIGSKEYPLTDTIYSGPDSWSGNPNNAGFTDSFLPGNITWSSGTIAGCTPNPATYVTVYFGSSSEVFSGCALAPPYTFSAREPTGSIFAWNTDGTFSYTKRDGTVIVYYGDCWSTAPYNGTCQSPGPRDVPKEIIYPNGRILTYWYNNLGTSFYYPISITRSDGLELKYAWKQYSNGMMWPSGVTAINNAYEYCDPTAISCLLKNSWPTATYAWSWPTAGGSVLVVTDQAQRVTTYTMDSKSRVVAIELPSSSGGENITYTYCDSNCSQYTYEGQFGIQYQNYVLSVTRDGYTWSYSGSPGGATVTQCGTASYGFTNPVGSGKQVSILNCLPNTQASNGEAPGEDPFISLSDEQGMVYNGPGPLIQSVVMPEGNETKYQWDGRGNLLSETRVAKSASGSIPSSATYDSTCTTPLTCNEPNSVTDGRGNVTTYTYNTFNGEIATITRPADSNDVQPKTQYTYAQLYAYTLNASGSCCVKSEPIWVLSQKTYCRTSAMTSGGVCVAGANDQITQTFQYGEDSGGAPNNLFLKGIAVTAGDITHLTCYGYDMFGHRISVTTPGAGLASCP
jgi:YD repeat-containing protein